MQRLHALALENIGTEKISSAALKTVRLIIDSSLMDVDANNVIELLTELADTIEIHQQSSLVASEIYQLLSTVLSKHQHLIAKVPQDVLNKYMDVEHWSFTLTNDNLSMQLHRLQWLMNYSSKYEIMLPKLSNAMLNKEVHHIFASGLHNSNEGLYSMTTFLFIRPILSIFKHLRRSKNFELCCKHLLFTRDHSVPTYSPFQSSTHIKVYYKLIEPVA